MISYERFNMQPHTHTCGKYRAKTTVGSKAVALQRLLGVEMIQAAYEKLIFVSVCVRRKSKKKIFIHIRIENASTPAHILNDNDNDNDDDDDADEIIAFSFPSEIFTNPRLPLTLHFS